MKYDRYYLSYTGISLPLKLVSPLTESEIANRNTWFGVCLDDDGRVVLIHKRVYGDVELTHRYQYDVSGRLRTAEIISADDEGQRLHFDDTGQVTAQEAFDVDD